MRALQIVYCFFLMVVSGACKKSTPTTDSAANAPSSLSQARRDYYQKNAFPEAKDFIEKTIPKERIAPSDAGNEKYYIARDASGNPLGMIRDFNGPVSPSQACVCNPLAFSMVFNPDRSLRTLLFASPLQKLGHVPMTPEEQERVIAIAKDPPPQLLEAKQVDDIVDVSTGATRKQYQPYVIPTGGLTTRRIVALVQETQSILQGTQRPTERARFEQFLAEQKSPAEMIRGVAEILPTLNDLELKIQAYRYLTSLYLEALKSGAAPNEAAETVLVNPGFGGARDGNELLAGCYRFAEDDIRRELLKKCIDKVEQLNLPPEYQTAKDRLRGTYLFLEGKPAEAAPLLLAAAPSFDIKYDPELHARLAGALLANGQAKEACDTAKQLFSNHPLFEKGRESLAACVQAKSAPNVDKVKERINQERRSRLIAAKRSGSSQAKVPTLTVEDDKKQPVALPLFAKGKATVVVFFATWCPHCRRELPRINEFAKQVESNAKLKEKIQVIGVRTAVERESEPYSEFTREFALKFPVYTDATMSLQFSNFAKNQNIALGLPTVAVVDEAGYVRYLLDAGDYNNTQEELQWTTEDVL